MDRGHGQEAYGWPQHVTSYAQPAAELLKTQNGRITPGALDAVLERGRRKKRFSYHNRPDLLNYSAVKVLATDTDLQQSGSSAAHFDKKVSRGSAHVSGSRGAVFRQRNPQRHSFQCGHENALALRYSNSFDGILPSENIRPREQFEQVLEASRSGLVLLSKAFFHF